MPEGICELCVESIEGEYQYFCERPFKADRPYHLTCLIATLEADLEKKRHIKKQPETEPTREE